MSKFEDLFGKKKEAVPVLDLSKSTANTKEDFKRLMERVPDFKTRPVKVRPEEIKIKEKECKEFKLSKKELKYLKNSQGEREKQYVYMDPVPTEMRLVSFFSQCYLRLFICHFEDQLTFWKFVLFQLIGKC